MDRRSFTAMPSAMPFMNLEKIADSKIVKELPENTIMRYFALLCNEEDSDGLLKALKIGIPDIIHTDKIRRPHAPFDKGDIVRGLVPFTKKNGFKTDEDLQKCIDGIYKKYLMNNMIQGE